MAERVSNRSDDYKKAIADRDAIEKQADKFLTAKDYESLIALLGHFTHADKSGGTAESDRKFFQVVDNANSRVSTLQRKISLSYLFATALLLLSSVLGSVSLNMTLKKVMRETRPAKAPNRRR